MKYKKVSFFIYSAIFTITLIVFLVALHSRFTLFIAYAGFFCAIFFTLVLYEAKKIKSYEDASKHGVKATIPLKDVKIKRSGHVAGYDKILHSFYITGYFTPPKSKRAYRAKSLFFSFNPKIVFDRYKVKSLPIYYVPENPKKNYIDILDITIKYNQMDKSKL